ALAASFDHLAERYDNPQARILGRTLDEATAQYLLNRKAPSRKGGEQDNRTSHLYVALYWARALADQTESADLAARFAPIAEALAASEAAIAAELIDVQGPAMDIGGYFQPDPTLTEDAMRPSETFNGILEGAMAETV
ncbi:MAG: NADP-dependent isocitrate dehydrogenase, partial [bacterium]|nr:NADP-dependent isocitrate dehydrogenase [bacterium]